MCLRLCAPGSSVNELIVGPNILAAVGDDHKAQRKMLNPVFSITHMRYLTPVFYETMHRVCRLHVEFVDHGSDNCSPTARCAVQSPLKSRTGL